MTNATTNNPQATFNQLQNEVYMTIPRADGTTLQASVAHGPLIGAPQFGLFVSVPEVESDQDDPRFAEDDQLEAIEVPFEPNCDQALLSLAETRLVRDFLNRPEVAALLDQE